jgi:hypothetical protein
MKSFDELLFIYNYFTHNIQIKMSLQFLHVISNIPFIIIKEHLRVVQTSKTHLSILSYDFICFPFSFLSSFF